MFRLLVFSTLVLNVSCKQAENLRTVELEGLGKVQGAKYWDGEFHEFYGIPYAKAPAGRDKYKAPLPPDPWTEPMRANKLVLTCQQVPYTEDSEEELFVSGDHDCLIAHLLVPRRADKDNLVPVIVYIHSGGFAGGSASMAKYYNVVKNDVITVAINYRVGALGFACLGTEDIPGNAALKDIIAALKWINKHIKSFGGDPNQVTLAGYSVGATLAELVALNKETVGLFDKLVLDSSSALTPFAINRDPIATAQNIAISLGLEDADDLEELTEFYLEEDLLGILNKSLNFFLRNSTFGFAPCIEKPGPGAVLTESPLDIIKRGDYPDFSLLIGFANMEGISRTSKFKSWIEPMNKNFEEFLPADLVFENVAERNAFIKEVKQKYFDGKKITEDSIQEYIDYFSDSMFKYSILKSAKLHAKNLKRPIYLYEFTYVGKLNTKHLFHDKVFGASHRDQTAYVLDFYDWTRNFTDMDMRELMINMWVEFSQYDNPTKFETKLNKIKWQKYTLENPNYLDIGYELVNKKNLFEDSYQFWDKAYQKHYWTPTAPKPEKLLPAERIARKKQNIKVEPVRLVDELPKLDEAKIVVDPVSNEAKDSTKTEGSTKPGGTATDNKKDSEPSEKPVQEEPSASKLTLKQIEERKKELLENQVFER